MNMEEAIVSLFAIVFYSLLDCPHNIDGHKTTEWMAHRKGKETKQQPGTARPDNIQGVSGFVEILTPTLTLDRMVQS